MVRLVTEKISPEPGPVRSSSSSSSPSLRKDMMYFHELLLPISEGMSTTEIKERASSLSGIDSTLESCTEKSSRSTTKTGDTPWLPRMCHRRGVLALRADSIPRTLANEHALKIKQNQTNTVHRVVQQIEPHKEDRPENRWPPFRLPGQLAVILIERSYDDEQGQSTPHRLTRQITVINRRIGLGFIGFRR